MASVDTENFAFSFSHGTIKLADVQYTAIKAISFSQDIERSAIFGTARVPLKRTVGQISLGEGSVTFSDLEEAMRFFAELGASAGGDATVATFAMDVTFANEGGETRQFELLGCSLSGFSGDFETGADALEMEFPLSFMRMKIDGVEFGR